jgi:hypothetical protein
MATDFTPYSTLNPLLTGTPKPTWIGDALDQQRILSYQLYEQIYWNVPETFKLVARGTEDKPIYLPNGKTIVETVNRYTAPNMKLVVTPSLVNPATSDDIVNYQQVWNDLFKRERFWSKFAGNKRYGLIRGDWLWYILADPMKPQGSRISIRPLDPGSYFPIWDEDDIDKIIGCHIVDQVANPVSGDVEIRRTTYRKAEVPGGPITMQADIFKLDPEWNLPATKPLRTITPLTTLAGITNLPVYHVRNFDEPSNPFGSSELRGTERIIQAANQAISDEELALALDGLGLYETDAPPPTDDDGNEINWVLGPGRVVEHPAGSNFGRVTGVGSVSPSLDHIKFLIAKLREGASTPDIAVGAVDVSIASSGIALSLQLSPLIALTAEKDTSIVEVHQQMFYDLQNEWLPVYESLRFDGALIEPMVGDKLPVDREARMAELNNMLDRQVVSAQYYRQEMAKLGYEFPSDIQDQIDGENLTRAINSDPFGSRLGEEASNNDQGQAQQGDSGGQAVEAQ